MPFIDSSKTDIHTALPFTQADYFHLVDATGKTIHEDAQLYCINANARLANPVRQRSFIPSYYPPILQRLGIDQKTWLQNVTRFEKRSGRAAFKVDKVLEYAKRLKGKGNIT